MNLLLLVLIIGLKSHVLYCAPKCEDFTTCGTCVFNTVDDCVWCSKEIHTGTRCQSKKQVSETWCKNETIRKRDKQLVISKNDDWGSGNDGKPMVQLKPQKVIVKSAAPGASVDIEISYKPAKDAPLDIYFLIDNTDSISVYRNSLINQTKTIFHETSNYTNNVHIGIGTFVEKPALPYANPEECLVYTFKNDLSLTNESDIFINTLKNIESGCNYDTPEDLLDGLMQVMLCHEQIKWRPDSRRIIVVFTNAFYHTAGDGKMVGAFKRHDVECHKNDSLDVTMDYPSIAQVNKVVKDNGYLVIFAYMNSKVKKHIVKDYYKLLSEEIRGAKYELLEDDNIAEIIKYEFSKIIEDIQLEYESSSNIEVNFKASCADCKALHSQPLNYTATITVLSCNTLKDKEVIKIKPRSLNEELLVEIEYQCQCECEKRSSTEDNLRKCNGQGDYQCGVCKCKPDRYGEDCACISESENSNDYEKCKKNPDDVLRCSGHGECRCGKCASCHDGFSGPFCEYDENACPRPGGKVCSGHGKCNMGICECYPKWTHSPNGIQDCGMSLEQRFCNASTNKDCCPDGEDSCDCDKCSWFIKKRCEELEGYAYCRFLDQNNCQEKYNLTDPTVVFANRSEINSPENVDWYMASLCRVKKGNDDKIFIFKYYYQSESDIPTDRDPTDTKLVIVIQTELDEIPPADIWVPVGSAIGGILLVGLLSLILWKVLADYYDAREYHQFEEKARAEGYDVDMTKNPWYEPPTTTFINPAHTPK